MALRPQRRPLASPAVQHTGRFDVQPQCFKVLLYSLPRFSTIFPLSEAGSRRPLLFCARAPGRAQCMRALPPKPRPPQSGLKPMRKPVIALQDLGLCSQHLGEGAVRPSAQAEGGERHRLSHPSRPKTPLTLQDFKMAGQGSFSRFVCAEWVIGATAA